MFGTSEHRWVFNKLEVAALQGLSAGPSGSVPPVNGVYIHRPVYNLYGMGVKAEKFFYHEDEDREAMEECKLVPPGSFWCQWLVGEHLSIDYRRLEETGEWIAVSVWQGVQDENPSLTRFAYWERLPEFLAPHPGDLPLKVTPFYDPRVVAINIETIGGVVTEIHLRLGDGEFKELPIGTKLIPVWNDEEAPEGVWFDKPEGNAGGYLQHERRGFVAQFPTKESPRVTKRTSGAFSTDY